MKNILYLTLFLLFSSSAYSQNYSYTFEGELNQTTLLEIEKRCQDMKEVSSAKVKYKEDAQKGEILIELFEDNKRRAEADDRFKAVDIKRILLDLNLNPGEFRQTK